MRRLIPLVALATLWACGDGDDLVLTLDSTGLITGQAYIDLNGDGTFSAGEPVAQGVNAAVVVEGTSDTVGAVATGANGRYLLPQIPVGRYRLLASRGSALGDSVDILSLDTARIILAARDTAVRDVRLGFPTATIAQLGQFAAGRRVALVGIALNGWTTFGDSTVHLADRTGSVRVLRAAPGTFGAGDSVRVLGAVATDQGRPVLADAGIRLLSAGVGTPPVPVVATAAAAAALGGLAYSQARIENAVIMDTAAAGRDRRLTVDDGSGPLVVLLDPDAGFTAAGFIPGGTLAATGLLVPAAGGGWQLKPRGPAEATVTFQATTIAAARAAELGRRVVLEGIALNRTATFGDSTVHLRDATGAIRAVRVLNQVEGGDSIRMIGTMALRNGQPVLTTSFVTMLRAGVGAGVPDSVSTSVASTAAGGTLDADQVRIGGTIVGTQSLPGGDFQVIADDGSGPLQLLLDQSAVPQSSLAQFQPGAALTARGVLVPTGTGTWRLQPRNASEASASFTTVTIAELRTLAAGRRVYVQGIALNGWSTFGDSTVHVADRTGAVRVVRLPSTLVFAGDSVRVLGTVALAGGQLVLLGASLDVLLAGVGLPPADSLSTYGAATALGGSRDAAQVRAAGRVASVQTAANGDTHLVLDDGSGALGVRLDRDAGFAPGAFQIGDLVNAGGLLVPEGTPAFWILKPRGSAEITAAFTGAPPIATFQTAWREYLTAQQPGGWSQRWDRSSAFVVAEDPNVREGKVLQWTGTSPARAHWALSFDGFGDITDQDVYTEFRVRVLGTGPTTYLMGSAAVRISGSATDERGYALFFGQGPGSARDLKLATFNAGAMVVLDAVPLAWSEDTWYSVRLEAVGTDIRARVWPRGEAEPADWTIAVSDDRYGSGRPGVVNADAGTVQWDAWEGRRR